MTAVHQLHGYVEFRQLGGAAVLLVLATACAHAPSVPPDRTSGLVYGPNASFFIDPPAGWVLDNASGVPQGLVAVCYPIGSSFADAPAILYANTAARSEGQSLAAYIESDLAATRADDPSVAIAPAPAITTADGHRSEVRVLQSGTRANFEAIAYFEGDAAFVLLVLQSRTREAYAQALPAFSEFVRSYAPSGLQVRPG